MQWYYCDVEKGFWHSKEFENDEAALTYFQKTYHPDIIYTENEDGSFRTIWEKL